MSSIRPLTNAMQKALLALNRTNDPKARMKAVVTIQASFGALEAQVTPPELFLTRLAFSYQIPMALGTVVDQGIAEALRDKALSSVEIEARCGLPSGKVSRLLRLLAGRGVFREVRPDVWANTAISKKLDSGLTVEEIKADPLGRYATGSPMTAWIQFTTEIGGLAAAATIPAFSEKEWKEATSITKTPFNYAFKTDLPLWQWLQEVDDGSRVRAFAKAMELNNTRSTDWGVYDWSALGENATLVDVGGGVGSAMAAILSVASNVKKVVIQDREPVLQKARSYWKAQNPAAVDEGKVEFHVHDFFQEQPIKGASAYFLRHIVHEQVWSDENCIKILKELHKVASDESKLIIVDAVINHACHNDTGPAPKNVEGASSDPWPAPLPANGGRATELDLLFDLHMLTMLNGQERTYPQFEAIAEQAGWKPKRVYETGNQTSLKILEFVKQ